MYLASLSAETLLLGGPQSDFMFRVALVEQSTLYASVVVHASHHLPIGSCLWKCSELENEVRNTLFNSRLLLPFGYHYI